MAYVAYKVNLDGSLSHKELLNNIDEVNEWLNKVYGKYATVRIVQEQTGKFRTLTDNGEFFVKIGD